MKTLAEAANKYMYEDDLDTDTAIDTEIEETEELTEEVGSKYKALLFLSGVDLTNELISTMKNNFGKEWAFVPKYDDKTIVDFSPEFLVFNKNEFSELTDLTIEDGEDIGNDLISFPANGAEAEADADVLGIENEI